MSSFNLSKIPLNFFNIDLHLKEASASSPVHSRYLRETESRKNV
jgi:hypothetical protein